MVSTLERFWILFILRFAIGFLFLFAALAQFGHGSWQDFGPEKFAEDLSKGFSGTWLAALEFRGYSGTDFVYYFLYGLPFAFAALGVLILTGLLLKTALRLSAILMVALGLGKYLQNDVTATVNDFFIAFLICVALYFISLQRPAPQSVPHPVR